MFVTYVSLLSLQIFVEGIGGSAIDTDIDIVCHLPVSLLSFQECVEGMGRSSVDTDIDVVSHLPVSFVPHHGCSPKRPPRDSVCLIKGSKWLTCGSGWPT